MSVLVVGGLAAGAAPARAATAPPSSPSTWIATAQDPARVQSALERYGSKLSPQFNERVQYVNADGTMRVMVLSAPRSALTDYTFSRSTTWFRWYRTGTRFVGHVTPDQLATLLASDRVKFIEPDFPLELMLETSAVDARARTESGGPRVLPDGTEDFALSAQSPSATWSGATASYGVTVTNSAGSIAGVRPLCEETTCDTYKLHLTDPGSLSVNATTPGGAVSFEIVRPDGRSVLIYAPGNDTAATTTLRGAAAGDYTLHVWTNSPPGFDSEYQVTASLEVPTSTAPDGLWKFEASGGLGALHSADPKLDANTATGKGVTVAVADSGIDLTHPDFGGFDCTAAPYAPCESRIKEAVAVDPLTGSSVNLAGTAPTTEAASGHGTHVAGTVAGNGYMARQEIGADSPTAGATVNEGIPIGVAPQASIVSVKIGDSQSAAFGVDALDWVAANAQRLGIRVVNNSWGCSPCAPSAIYNDAIKNVYDQGVLVVFASGNEGGTDNGTQFGGNGQSPYALSVANYDDSNHMLNSGSSRGERAPLPEVATWTPESEPGFGYRRPDVAAPGTDIRAARTLTGGTSSAAPRADSGDTTGEAGDGTSGYVAMTGTSMSAPHVSGAAALLFSACPSARVLDVMRALMGGANRTLVRKTGDQATVAEGFEVGYGALDVRASLNWLRARVAACSVNSPPVAAITAPASVVENSTATFDGSGSSDPDGAIASYAWDFGDGTTGSGVTAAHAYARPGTYTVTLLVADSDGAAATTTRTVTVTPEPDPDPATPTLTSGQGTPGTAAARDAQQVYKLRVRPGDTKLEVVLDGPTCGSRCKPNLDLYVRNGAQPTLTAFDCKSAGATSDETCTIADPAPGYWYVGVLTATGKDGAPFTLTATASHQTVEPPPNEAPVAGFTSTCEGRSCTFTDSSSDVDGTVVSRSWDFGDGATSTATDAVHEYAALGAYAVALTVTDDDGATHTATRTIDLDASTPVLDDGVARTDTSGLDGWWGYYRVFVPAGTSTLTVSLAATQTCADPVGLLFCSPDLDLYTRAGEKPATGTGNFACSPQSASSDETCTMTDPAPGWWYVGVNTFDDGLLSDDTVTFTVTADRS